MGWWQDPSLSSGLQTKMEFTQMGKYHILIQTLWVESKDIYTALLGALLVTMESAHQPSRAGRKEADTISGGVPAGEAEKRQGAGAASVGLDWSLSSSISRKLPGGLAVGPRLSRSSKDCWEASGRSPTLHPASCQPVMCLPVPDYGS